MRKLINICVGMLLWSWTMEAQTLSDALRYSYFNPSGTARSLSLGGSMSVFGGDFGSLNINPAGIGTYRSSEFMVSPTAYSSTTTASLNALDYVHERPNISLKIDNLGMVFHHSPTASPWKTSNFAIGVNKMNNLNQSFTYRGTTKGSITERFVERANGKTVDEMDNFEAFPAWETYAIDPNPVLGDNQYKSHISESDEVYKEQTVDTRGRVSELFFGLGGNLNEKVQVGGSIGIPLISYREEKTYEEKDPDNDISTFDQLSYTEYLRTSGSGVNLKLGMIYNITKSLKIGAAAHSPNYYVLTDDYYTSLSYKKDGETARDYTSIDGNFKYRLASPWRLVGSIGGIFKAGKVMGLAQAEMEYLDYRNAYFNLGAFSSNKEDKALGSDLNDQIEVQLKDAMNYRAGVELAYEKLRLRAGVHLNGSPYGKDDSGTYFAGYSLGIGHRGDNFYIDAAYRIAVINEGYIPYLVLDQDRLQLVENEVVNQNFVLTFGFKF